MLAVCTATNCEIEQLWKAIDSVSPASESLNFSASPEQWSEEKFTDALSLYTPGIA